jgi:hypothetical protein
MNGDVQEEALRPIRACGLLLTSDAALRASTSMGSLAGRPPLDVGTQPELDAALTQIDYWLGHIVVPLLVLADGIPVRQAEDVRNTLRVEQILGCNSRCHGS